MGYNAGIQLHGSRKPIIPIVQQMPNVHKKKPLMKEKLKRLLAKKDFLDKKTVKWLENQGLINTNI